MVCKVQCGSHLDYIYIFKRTIFLYNLVKREHVTGLKKLKHLNLSGCRQLTDKCLEIVKGIIHHKKQLYLQALFKYHNRKTIWHFMSGPICIVSLE